jgi:hypothetical protein
VEWKKYDVRFCKDSMLEYEVYILVSLLDKRIALWDNLQNEEEVS